MPRRSFRRSRKVRRPRSTKRRRTFRRGGRGGGMDTHHFKQTVNGGMLILPTGFSQTASTGGFIMRLQDMPLYQQMAPNFEFARLNKCSIEFIPKSNMQLNQITTDVGALVTTSVSGTLTTAIDQIPFFTPSTHDFVSATSWTNDSSNDTGVSSATAVSLLMTTDYVRGLTGSREKELYKKHKISFYPAFYDYVMSGSNATSSILTDTNQQPVAGSSFITNGCVERKIKKWISINTITAAGSGGVASTIAVNNGPLYFGPIYALDVNVPGTTASLPLFDVRFRYSISFKRVRGV